MRLLCLHRWQIVGAEQHWVEDDFDRIMYTFVAYFCPKCRGSKTKKLRGRFAYAFEQLKEEDR